MRPECKAQLSLFGKQRGADNEGGAGGVMVQVTTSVFVRQIREQEHTQTHTYSLQISDDNVRRKEGFGVTNETCFALAGGLSGSEAAERITVSPAAHLILCFLSVSPPTSDGSDGCV